MDPSRPPCRLPAYTKLTCCEMRSPPCDTRRTGSFGTPHSEATQMKNENSVLQRRNLQMGQTLVRDQLELMIRIGSRLLGSFVRSNDTSTTAIFGAIGFDGVTIYREHGMIGLEAPTLQRMQRANQRACGMRTSILSNGTATAYTSPKSSSASCARRLASVIAAISSSDRTSVAVRPLGNWSRAFPCRT